MFEQTHNFHNSTHPFFCTDCLQAIMPNFSDRDLNDLLRVIDTNGNGVVEYDELHGTHSRPGEQMGHI